MGILINENQIGGGASNTSHNIGDIFYTTRTDNSLNGAVECNGSQYNFSDFDSNLQTLFDDGKLPYIPIGEFDAMVTNQGGCDSFGYGPGDSYYGWTSMYGGPYYTKSETPKTNEDLYVKEDNLMVYYGIVHGFSETGGVQIDGDGHYAGRESSLDEIDNTPTTYFKVPKKLSRVLVRTQKPTADNNYTWYNVYADGWVEQGGYVDVSGSSAVSTTYSIELKDAVCPDINFVYGFQSDIFVKEQQVISMTTTGFSTRGRAINDNNKVWENGNFYWRVVGYANSAEYTKDKWNYQNIQVERCMVQLFNSTTDTAVATCNQVLADVSALNQGDYVIETQLPTEENNYSWYRLYKSGWVEQGGFCSGTAENNPVTLAIEMKDTEYTIVATNMQTTAVDAWGWVLVSKDSKTTTGFSLGGRQGTGNTTPVRTNWQVSGMSAQGT